MKNVTESPTEGNAQKKKKVKEAIINILNILEYIFCISSFFIILKIPLFTYIIFICVYFFVMRFFTIIFSIFFTLSYGQDQVVLKHNITHLETFSQGEFPHTKTLYEVDFQNRMQLLDSLYTLPMEVNSINFYYTQKYLSYNWIGKVIGLSGYLPFPFLR